MARSLLRCRSNARLLERAASFLANHNEVVIIAPTRAAASELALQAFDLGRQGLHSFTLIQLAAHFAAQPMGKQGMAPISSLGIEAIATRIVHAAMRDNKLSYFSPVAKTPGFPRALARTIAELRLQHIPAHELASDLTYLMELYEHELRQRSLADLAMLLKFATEEASTSAHRFTGLPLLLVDLTVESRSHETFLAALVEKSPDVLAVALHDDEQSVASVLHVAAEDLDTEPPSGTLDRVRRWLFSPDQPPAAPTDPSLLFSAPGENLECLEIARRIRALAAEGTPFDRVAILLRNVDQYQPLVEEALRRAAIPHYFGRGAARPDPAGRAFLALLACAGDGCSASRFAEYLSLGQLPPVDQNGAPIKPTPQWVPPADEILASFQTEQPPPEDKGPAQDSETTLAVPIGWEKLLVDAAVIGGHDRWARRLRGLRAEFQAQLRNLDKEDETHRPHIQRRIDQIARLESFALPLIDMLSALPLSAHWGDWLDRLSELAQTALRYPESVLAVLSELKPMSEVGPTGLDEVYDVLSEKMGTLRTDPPRRRYGHVFVGAIDEARGRAFDVVFLPGLAEGLFPRRSLEDPLLLDEQRARLETVLHTPGLLDTQPRRNARERMLLRSAAAAAIRQLVVSYPRMDTAQARPRVPSFYALEVLRAAEGRLPTLREFRERAATSAPSRLDWPAPTDPNVAIDDAEYDLASLETALKLPRECAKGSARYLVEVNRSLTRSLRTRGRRWRNRWTSADGLVDPDPATLPALQAHRFSERSYSPSALQHFAACPYRFLLQAIFQFRPREAPVPLEKMDPLTRGALFHAVQFDLFRKLKADDLLPITAERRERTLDLADQVLDQVAAQFEDDLAPAIQRVWKREIEDVRTDLRGWIQQLAATPSDWLPLHFEFAFGLAADQNRDPESTKAEATILNGIRLRGAIDLIEKHSTSGHLRVTDHKTGKAPQNRPQYVGGGAILQPLLYALAAEQLLQKPVEAGSLYFCTQRGDFSTITIPLDTPSRDRVKRVLSTIGEFVEEGFLPAAPQTGACAICDYRPVCGPYEEQRSKRKQPERIEPLINIRNMP